MSSGVLVCGDRAVAVYDQVFETVVQVCPAAEAELIPGDVVAFIDDDAVAEEAVAERLVRAYEEEDAIAAGGKDDARMGCGEASVSARGVLLASRGDASRIR